LSAARFASPDLTLSFFDAFRAAFRNMGRGVFVRACLNRGTHMQVYLRIGVALAAIALPLSALAQTPPPAAPPPPTMEQKFTAANTSGTGCLTYREAKAARLGGIMQQFQAIDLAHHGCITLPEIKAYRHGTRNLD
jgi:hypothetical protein